MSAVRREQPVRLPTDRGVVGSLVTDASDEELQACLATDRRFLYGGEVIVDDVTTHVTGFLNDASLNPGRHETVQAFLASTDERSANYRAVRRVALRIAAVEEELRLRTEQQHAESSWRREEARMRLVAWREGVPTVVAEFEARAAQAARDWALVAPIAAALLRLQQMYPSDQADLRAQYARLVAHHREVARALDPESSEHKPLPDLPPGLPSFEQVRDCANVFNTNLEWPDSRVPSTGLEKINLARALRDAGG